MISFLQILPREMQEMINGSLFVIGPSKYLWYLSDSCMSGEGRRGMRVVWLSSCIVFFPKQF